MEQTYTTAVNIPRVIHLYQPSASDDKIEGPQVHLDICSNLSCNTLLHSSVVPSEENIYQKNKVICKAAQETENVNLKPTNSHVMHIELSDALNTQTLHLTSQTMLTGQHSGMNSHMSQNQIVMDSNIHNLQQDTSHPAELTPLLTSHIILPPVFKQHMVMNGVQQYFGQFEYQKESFQAKIEPEVDLDGDANHKIIKNENAVLSEFVKPKRSKIPNPNKWACNLRKIKHQSGEAYISRRGKYVPERKVKNMKDCTSCIHKCSNRINETDREHIFKAFWSLSSNEKKHFLLNTTDRYVVDQRRSKSSETELKKKYTFKYFFLVRGVRYIVCKKFYLGTLAISQKPIYNVHLGKSEVNVPKPDGRGLSESSSHSLPTEMIERVKNHITSFKTTDLKPVKKNSKKKQFLNSNLSIKQMYTMYVTECSQENIVPVKEHMYRKVFKQEFNLNFKRDQKLCCKCQGPLRKE